MDNGTVLIGILYSRGMMITLLAVTTGNGSNFHQTICANEAV